MTTSSVLTPIIHSDQLLLAIWRNNTLPTKVKNFLMALADHWNYQSQTAFPSRRTLAGCLGLSPSRISFYIKTCVKKGIIESKARFVKVSDSNPKKRQTSNEYRFNLEFFGFFYDTESAKRLKEKKRRQILKKEKDKSHSKNQSTYQSKIYEEANRNFDNKLNSILNGNNLTTNEATKLIDSLRKKFKYKPS